MNRHMAQDAAQDTALIDSVIQEIGVILQQQGTSRIAGTIFGLLIVEGVPMSLHDMASRLNISRASASTNARHLARAGLIPLTARLGDRQDYYELVPDPFVRLLETIKDAMVQAAEALAAAAGKLPPGHDAARRRVTELADIHRMSSDFVTAWTDRIRPRDASSGEGKQ